MSSISPVSRSQVGRPAASVDKAESRPVEVAATAVRRGSDKVEVSDVARLVARMNEMPPIRTDLVERVRSEIESGRYETPERTELAIDAMLDELAGGL